LDGSSNRADQLNWRTILHKLRKKIRMQPEPDATVNMV
jgi:hypothetical protein